jgi:hypothetical protein
MASVGHRGHAACAYCGCGRNCLWPRRIRRRLRRRNFGAWGEGPRWRATAVARSLPPRSRSLSAGRGESRCGAAPSPSAQILRSLELTERLHLSLRRHSKEKLPSICRRGIPASDIWRSRRGVLRSGLLHLGHGDGLLSHSPSGSRWRRQRWATTGTTAVEEGGGTSLLGWCVCARPHATVAQGQCCLFTTKLTPFTPLHRTGVEALFNLK